MQARFYAPWFGRFLSPGPARDQHFEETQSWNIYGYVQNDPTMKADPTGMVLEFTSDAKKLLAVTWNGIKSLFARGNHSKSSGGGHQQVDAVNKTGGHSENAPTPGRKIWVSPTPDGGTAKGKLVDDGKGSYKGQCVSLVKKQTGIPPTSTWHQGTAVQGNTDIKPGTVIAAAKNGKDWSGGGHVGLYVGQDAKSGLRMTDQFVTGGDHPVATRTYAWKGHGDQPSVQSQGAKYHVVETGK